MPYVFPPFVYGANVSYPKQEYKWAAKTRRKTGLAFLPVSCDNIFVKSSRRTALRDIHLLKQAGVPEAKWDRKRQAFVPVAPEPFPMEVQENKTRQQGFDDEPGRWCCEIPGAYGLTTIPGMKR